MNRLGMLPLDVGTCSTIENLSMMCFVLCFSVHAVVPAAGCCCFFFH